MNRHAPKSAGVCNAELGREAHGERSGLVGAGGDGEEGSEKMELTYVQEAAAQYRRGTDHKPLPRRQANDTTQVICHT